MCQRSNGRPLLVTMILWTCLTRWAWTSVIRSVAADEKFFMRNSGLPQWDQQLRNSYDVIHNKPVDLTCRATPVIQITFYCGGRQVSIKEYKTTKLTDPVTGHMTIESSISVSWEDVDNYHGHDDYWCECWAWNIVRGFSTPQNIKSNRAYIKAVPVSTAPSCSNDTFDCLGDGSKCISYSLVCDGSNDCGNNEDEQTENGLCPSVPTAPSCSSDTFDCLGNGSKCISYSLVCDGSNDCGNNEDEQTENGLCPSTAPTAPSCSNDTFDCLGDGSKCISYSLVCDGSNDCGNNEDEQTENGLCPHPEEPEEVTEPARTARLVDLWHEALDKTIQFLRKALGVILRRL